MLKLIEATNVIQPDGSEAKRVVLLATACSRRRSERHERN